MGEQLLAVMEDVGVSVAGEKTVGRQAIHRAVQGSASEIEQIRQGDCRNIQASGNLILGNLRNEVQGQSPLGTSGRQILNLLVEKLDALGQKTKVALHRLGMRYQNFLPDYPGDQQYGAVRMGDDGALRRHIRIEDTMNAKE